MDKINNKKTLLKKLNIKEVENIPDKLNDFISLLPSIDKDLAIQIINQLPEYRETCNKILDTLDASCDKALSSADKSLAKTIDAYSKILDTLSERLLNETLSESEKTSITKDMLAVADKIAYLHKEHENFIVRIIKIIFFPIFGIASIFLFMIGAKKK